MDQVVLAAAEDGRFDIMLFVYNFLQREAGEKDHQGLRGQGRRRHPDEDGPGPDRGQSETGSAGRRRRSATRRTARSCPRPSLKLKQRAAERAAVTEAFLKQARLLGAAEKVRDAAIMFCLNNPGVHAVCPSINSFEALEHIPAAVGSEARPDRGRGCLDDCREAYRRHVLPPRLRPVRAVLPAGRARQRHHALRVLLRGQGAGEGGHGPLRRARPGAGATPGCAGCAGLLRGGLPLRRAHPGQAPALPRGPDALKRRRRPPPIA
ncbi:MAG: hypothetical protein MZU79_07285 [Anaerotruncus sp.]|nr:hypothetical protein [Anaerotruncus sp.]